MSLSEEEGDPLARECQEVEVYCLWSSACLAHLSSPPEPQPAAALQWGRIRGWQRYGWSLAMVQDLQLAHHAELGCLSSSALIQC
jgi:hypothetical protein